MIMALHHTPNGLPTHPVFSDTTSQARAKAETGDVQTMDVQNLDADWFRKIAAVVDSAIATAFPTQKEAAHAIGVDEAELNKWCSGAHRRRPQFDKLMAVPKLRPQIVIGLANLDDRMQVVHTITVRER